MNYDCLGETRILVATSIAPNNIENQRKAIDTWIESGLEVISFNCLEEYEVISKHFPDIRFEIVQRTGKDRFGKPYVFFDSIMAYFTSCAYKICGIINSDIYLHKFDKEVIYHEAIDSLVFGSRIEISSLDNLNGTICYGGYDYFFFNREISSIYPESEFCIGLPVWDHWIVFVPMILGIEVKEIMIPSAFHFRHDIKWRWDLVDSFGKEIYYRYFDKLGRFEEFIDNGTQQINFEKIFNKYATKLLTHNCSDSKGILVVYNGPRDSLTYNSIQNQTYRNFRVIEQKDLQLDFVREELICFIQEGNKLDSCFLELMEHYIGNKECVICGIQLKNNYSIFVENIYPFDFDKSEIDRDSIDECIVFKTDFYKSYGHNRTKLAYEDCALLGRGLVQVDYNHYILNRKLRRCEGHQLCIYGAGGHTRKLLNEINSSSLNIMAIFDSDVRLDGTDLGGYTVYHKSKLSEFDFDFILISSQSYEEEIYKELLQQVDCDKIIRIYGK